MIDTFYKYSGRVALYTLGGLILLFLILPSVLIVPMSFSPTNFLQFPPTGFSTRWYVAYFSDAGWIDATWFSIQIAVLVTITSSIIGTMAAISLVRGDVPGQDALGAVLLAPLIVPHVIVAIAVYFQFAPLGLNGTRLGFLLIHTALAVPYVVLLIFSKSMTTNLHLMRYVFRITSGECWHGAKAIERSSKEAVACRSNAAKRQRLRRGCAGSWRGTPNGVHMEGAAR